MKGKYKQHSALPRNRTLPNHQISHAIQPIVKINPPRVRMFPGLSFRKSGAIMGTRITPKILTITARVIHHIVVDFCAFSAGDIF